MSEPWINQDVRISRASLYALVLLLLAHVIEPWSADVAVVSTTAAVVFIFWGFLSRLLP